jgi:hypothetical protein
VVEENEAQARAAAGVPSADLAPGVPYEDLTVEQKRARMAAARPAGWGTDEANVNANLVTARMLKQGP